MPRTRVVALAAALTAALTVAVLAVVGAGPVGTVVRDGRHRPPVAASAASPDSPASLPTSRTGGREPDPVRALAGWDRRRAKAWRLGSPRRLADLYVAGSSAGTRDVEALRGWRGRGLRVAGMHMQLLEVAVLARTPDRWRLAVTDRLVGATAVRDGRRTPLPRDRASRHVVTLMRGGDGRWRVATVAGP